MVIYQCLAKQIEVSHGGKKTYSDKDTHKHFTISQGKIYIPEKGTNAYKMKGKYT